MHHERIASQDRARVLHVMQGFIVEITTVEGAQRNGSDIQITRETILVSILHKGGRGILNHIGEV